MSTFFTETLTRALPGLIDSNDTRADATAADMAADKKRHMRHTDTICSSTGGRGGSAGRRKVDFVGSVVERASRTSRKRISPINCQSNLVTQKIPPPHSSYTICWSPLFLSRPFVLESSRPAPKEARSGTSGRSLVASFESAPSPRNRSYRRVPSVTVE